MHYNINLYHFILISEIYSSMKENKNKLQYLHLH